MATPPPPPAKRLCGRSLLDLPDDVIPEILLRLPPHDPRGLVRCSAVCKPWRRLLTGEENDHELFVWSPVTDERWGMPMPCPFSYWNVAVLCAAAAREGGCDCDHLGCHGGPFLVVFVDTDEDWMAYARVYSSETGAWSDEIYAEHPNHLVYLDMLEPIALVGNRIYFPAAESKAILEYDLGRQKLAFLDPPSAHQGRGIVMPAMGGGGLGFASVRGSRLHLWSRETGSSDRTAAAWTQSRVLELSTTALGTEILRNQNVFPIGFAEGHGVIFVGTSAGVFVIKLKSGQVKKISSRKPSDVVIPYMSFYTPDHATG